MAYKEAETFVRVKSKVLTRMDVCTLSTKGAAPAVREQKCSPRSHAFMDQHPRLAWL
jgi:hypothetical protein